MITPAHHLRKFICARDRVVVTVLDAAQGTCNREQGGVLERPQRTRASPESDYYNMNMVL